MRGFEVATMYRPAGEVNEVGGDFYEAFEIDGGWMVAIGDVMGRGAAAASRDGSGSLHDPHGGKADRRSPLAPRGCSTRASSRAWTSRCAARSSWSSPTATTIPCERRCSSPGIPCRCSFEPERWNRSDSRGRCSAPPTSQAGTSPRWSCRAAISSCSTPTASPRLAARRDRFGEDRLRDSLSTVTDPPQTVAQIESALDSFLAGPPEDDAAMLVDAATEHGAPADAQRVALPGPRPRQAANEAWFGRDRAGYCRGKSTCRPLTIRARNEDVVHLRHGAAHEDDHGARPSARPAGQSRERGSGSPRAQRRRGRARARGRPPARHQRRRERGLQQRRGPCLRGHGGADGRLPVHSADRARGDRQRSTEWASGRTCQSPSSSFRASGCR